LLGLFRMPADLVALFVVSGIWGARFGDLLGVMHLTAFALLTASSERGWLRVRPIRTAGWLAGSVVAVAAAMWLNYAVVGWSIAGQPPPANQVKAMQPYFEGAAVVDDGPATADLSQRMPGETSLEGIRRTGKLRLGYRPGNPPFSYRNDDNVLVGLEVDLAYRLAVELEAELQLVAYESGSLEAAFAADRFDLAIGGLASLVRDPAHYRESDPYLELNAAFVVPDHRADDFDSMAKIRAMERIRLGYVEGGTLVRTGRHRLSGIELVALPSADVYLGGDVPAIDALLTTAETGAIYSMTYPAYSVVVPEGLRVRVPAIIAVATDEEFDRTVNRFIRIKRSDGTIEALYEHWILGASFASTRRRWSVVKDVLGWDE
jgi:ABC-type amino acid transport substrate-binding protein